MDRQNPLLKIPLSVLHFLLRPALRPPVSQLDPEERMPSSVNACSLCQVAIQPQTWPSPPNAPAGALTTRKYLDSPHTSSHQRKALVRLTLVQLTHVLLCSNRLAFVFAFLPFSFVTEFVFLHLAKWGCEKTGYLD